MKTFFKIFGILLVLIIVGISIFLWTFDLNSYRGYIAEKLSSSLGRPVTIERLEMKLSLIPTIQATNVAIANSDSFQSEKPLFMANTAEITLALAPLLSHRLEVQKVAFGSSVINLIKQNNKNNWTSDNTKPVSQKETSTPWIEEMRFDNIVFSRIAFLFKTDDQTYTSTITDFSIKQLKLFSFNALIDSQTLKITGNGNEITNLFSGKPDYLFNIEASTPSLTARLNGNIGDTKQFQKLVFKINLTSNNLKNALRIFHIENNKIPAMPAEISADLQGSMDTLEIAKLTGNIETNKVVLNSSGTIEDILQTPKLSLLGSLTLTDKVLAKTIGLNPIATQFNVSATQENIKIKELTLQANQSDLRLSSEITDLRHIPTLAADISSNFINIADFISQTESDTPLSAYSEKGQQRAIPDSYIDLSGLKKFNSELHIQLPYIQIGTNAEGYLGLEGNIHLKNGILSTDTLKGNLLDGTFSAQMAIDTQSEIPTYKLKAAFQNLKLEKFPSVGAYIQNSNIICDINAQTSGVSSLQLARNLNGEIMAEISEGTITSDWFNNLPIVDFIARQKTSALTYSNSDKISKLLCGAAHINIRDGIFNSTDQIALETSNINFLLSGSFNLPTEEINLSIKPIFDYSDPKLNALSSMGQFVKITGTLSNMKPTLTTEGVLSQLTNIANLTPRNTYALCQTILNRKTIGQQRNEEKKATVISFPTQKATSEKELTPQEQFQEQLIKNMKKVLN